MYSSKTESISRLLLRTLAAPVVAIVALAITTLAVIGQVQPNEFEDWWVNVATEFNAFSPIQTDPMFSSVSAQSLNGIISPHGPACEAETRIKVIKVALSKCGNPDSDIQLTLHSGSVNNPPVATSWIEGSTVTSYDHLDPSWVQVEFDVPVLFDTGAPLLVRLQANRYNVLGHYGTTHRIAEPDLPVSQGSEHSCPVGEGVDGNLKVGASGGYRWSIDRSDPYVAGAYEGVVSPFMVMEANADAGLQILLNTVTDLKVVLAAYDPVTPEGRLHNTSGNWYAPDRMARDLEAMLEDSSAGTIEVDVELLYLDKFPLRSVCINHQLYESPGGCPFASTLHRYSLAEFTTDMTDGRLYSPVPGSFSYQELMGETTATNETLMERVNSGEVDEIWVWSDGSAGTWEATMIGPGGYNVNGGPVDVPGVERRVIVMGYNGQNGRAEALHSYAHRTTAIMDRVFGPGSTPMTHFETLHVRSPGNGSVGDVHHAHNGIVKGTGIHSYDYTNHTHQLSDADDWFSWPNMPEPAERLDRNCELESGGWDCSQAGYFDYWFERIPHFAGETEGVPNNWYRKFVHPGCFPD